jgi:hypothetical protein
MATLAASLDAAVERLHWLFLEDQAAYQLAVRQYPVRVLLAALATWTGRLPLARVHGWYTALLTGVNGESLAALAPEPILWGELVRQLREEPARQAALCMLWGLAAGRAQPPEV